MEDEDGHRELQLLPAPPAKLARLSPRSSETYLKHRAMNADPLEPPSLDLQLSISLRPLLQPANCGEIRREMSSVEALRRHAAEQRKLAAVEKAYAERLRELTRREMELAESEFAQAKRTWERAQQEVEGARRLTEKATACMEITCQACHRRFRA